MKQLLFLTIPLLCGRVMAPAQVTFTDSNLPIVVITTDGGREIPDEPKILGNMKIIYRGPGARNYLSDQSNPAYLNYNGRIAIEIRGSITQVLPKKQYGFTTVKADGVSNNNVKLLGMPSENDWILNGLGFDPALMRDYISYNLARSMGAYASRTAYCEVVINGAYKGLYVLQEKIKVDGDRVDITKITTSDNTLPNLSGGYIVKADKTTGGDPVAWRMASYVTTDSVTYVYDSPDPEDITPSQRAYIKGEFDRLASTAAAGNTSFVNGYPSVIDVPSFLDFILLNELASNSDAYQYSTFFHKDRNGKLRAGPIWDLNLSFGNDLFLWGYDRSKTNVWQLNNRDNEGSKFWKDLFNNPTFRCYLSKRWNELTQPGKPLHYNAIEALVDQTAATISEAAVRNNTQWGGGGALQNNIDKIKTFAKDRIAWITANIGSFAACNSVATPPLVITRIMYNPKSSPDFPDTDLLEYLEIKNNGNQSVSLTGVYFSGLGLTYQFPSGTSIAANASIRLASHAATYQAKYKVAPFGQFTGNLSNSSQNLVLVDGFGNLIDQVQYFDSAPWPNADGNGYFLELIDPALDNNVAANWRAASDAATAIVQIEAGRAVQLFPNPVADQLSITSEGRISVVLLYDMQGRLLQTIPVNGQAINVAMAGYNSGSYILKVLTPTDTWVGKVIRQ